MEDKDRLETRSLDPLLELSGTALRAYLVLLRSRKPMGVRELQRALRLRSPSTARHHLERLEQLGLVKREQGGYVAVPPRRGFLKAYLILHGRLVPRSLALTAFLGAATITYSILPGHDPVAVTVLLLATLISLHEAIDSYKAIHSLLKEGE